MGAGRFPGCASRSATRAPLTEPWAWFKALAVAILKFRTFERGTPRFYFALGPTNDVTAPGGRIVSYSKEIWRELCSPFQMKAAGLLGPRRVSSGFKLS